MTAHGPTIETNPAVHLSRFCGDVEYPVKNVSTFVSRPRGAVQEGGVLLNLEVACGPAVSETCPENERIGWAEPTFEVWIPVPDATPDALDGLEVAIPWKYLASRDAKHRLYVFEHGGLWGVTASFRRVDPHTCEATVRASACDPNHYDGSKPEAKVSARFRFTLARATG